MTHDISWQPSGPWNDSVALALCTDEHSSHPFSWTSTSPSGTQTWPYQSWNTLWRYFSIHWSWKDKCDYISSPQWTSFSSLISFAQAWSLLWIWARRPVRPLNQISVFLEKKEPQLCRSKQPVCRVCSHPHAHRSKTTWCTWAQQEWPDTR